MSSRFVGVSRAAMLAAALGLLSGSAAMAVPARILPPTAVSLALVVHAALESSEPVPGDTLSTAPEALRLTFSEPIENEFAVITVTGGDGRVIRLSPRSDPLNGYALIADWPELSPGGYLVSWRVVSADGHPVGGFFQFYSAIGPAGKTRAEILAGTPAAPDPPAGAESGPAGLTGEPPIFAAVLRGVAQISILGAAGLLALLTWGIRSDDTRLRRLERLLVLAAPLLLAADFLLWLQHASPSGAVDGDALSAAVSTRNGLLYASRAGLALLAAWALLLARSGGLAAVFAALAVVATGATGHPAAISPLVAVPGKIVHLIAAAIWTAGLLVLAFGRRDRESFRQDAWRVSRIALISVIAIALTGVVETLLFLPRLSGLFSSAYGWLVIAKLAGLGVLVAFGARNRYRLMPALESSGPAPLRRSVTWEVGWMAAVVVLAAFLAYVPPPNPKAQSGGMTGHEGHIMPPPPEEHP